MSAAHLIHSTFLKNNIIEYRPNISGQSFENHKFILGDRAGPSRDLSNLLHEICHFAEREIGKLKSHPTYGWGFYLGKYWQIGTRWGYEPTTDQQVQREARVWAFQLACQRQFNLNDSAFELIKSAVFLPAWCYFTSKYKFKEKKALYKLSCQVERMSRNRWNYQRLLDDFNERINALNEKNN